MHKFLFCRHRSAAPHALNQGSVVGEILWRHFINIAALPIPNKMLTEGHEVATAEVCDRKSALIVGRVVPQSSCYIVTICFTARWKEPVRDGVAAILKRIADSVRASRETLPLRFKSMIADTSWEVAITPPCDSIAAIIAANPHDAIVEFDRAGGRDDALLDESSRGRQVRKDRCPEIGRAHV